MKRRGGEYNANGRGTAQQAENFPGFQIRASCLAALTKVHTSAAYTIPITFYLPDMQMSRENKAKKFSFYINDCLHLLFTML